MTPHEHEWPEYFAPVLCPCGVEFHEWIEAELRRMQAQLNAAEWLIEVVRAREIGTSGGVGAAFEAYDLAVKSVSAP